MVAFLLLAAGCIASEGSEQSASDSPAPPATVDAETGGIEGTVTDDGLSPIANAEVAVLEQDMSTRTDEAGFFSLSRVPPGKTTVAVAKLGYESVARVVEVVAGEVVELKLQLKVLSVKEAYYRTHTAAAFVGCSMDVRQSNSNASILTFAVCGVVYYAGGATVDKFRVDWDLGETANTTGLVVESSWRSTQPAGNGIRLLWATYQNETYSSLLSLQGKTPLKGLIDGKEFIKKKGGNSPGQLCSNACHLTSFHYTFANTFNGAYAAEAGVTIQQRVDDYVTLFFAAEPPESFSALPPPS